MALTMAACGGGGGDGDVPGEALVSGPAEFTRCAVPEQISIVREDESAAGWKTNRYLKFAGQALTKLVAGPGMVSTKNPEGVLTHGPLHAQNCTPGAGTSQSLTFRLRTLNFFDKGVGDHLSFGLRSKHPTLNALGNESYDSIGIIFHKPWGAVTAERFGYPSGNDVEAPNPPQVEVQDNVTYLVEIVAASTQISYRVTKEGAGQTTGWKQYQQPANFAALQGTGLMFAVLCSDANGQCEAYNTPFKIELWDIAAGWF
ncbi:MAG TPA: hypothetical protein VLJ57_08305 [Burkholderiaceae bacterium]|nr:hypothetical protein [Burkholderiaceae bacterium]